MEYNELMKALGENLGLEDFLPDGEGVYSLSIDDVVVSFIPSHENGQMDIIAAIGSIPSEGGDAFCETLLSAMAPGGSAEDYTFFMEPEEQAIYLRRAVVLEAVDGAALRQELENFVRVMDEWSQSIENFRQEPITDNEKQTMPQAEEDGFFDMNSDGILQV